MSKDKGKDGIKERSANSVVLGKGLVCDRGAGVSRLPRSTFPQLPSCGLELERLSSWWPKRRSASIVVVQGRYVFTNADVMMEILRQSQGDRDFSPNAPALHTDVSPVNRQVNPGPQARGGNAPPLS